MPTLYDVMGAEPGADARALRRAFRATAQRLHPDHFAERGAGAIAAATAAMEALNGAWDVLGDPLRRADYDASLGAEPEPPPQPVRHDPPRRSSVSSTFPDAVADPFAELARPTRAVFREGEAVTAARLSERTRVVFATGSGTTDDDLVHLRRSPNLSTLELDDTSVSDAALDHFAHVPRLAHLSLDSTEVTDSGIFLLPRLVPRLETLSIGNTVVTDRGVAALAELTGLTVLLLRQAPVTAAGLAALDDLPLRLLAMPRHVTWAERRRLRQVHPGIALT